MRQNACLNTQLLSLHTSSILVFRVASVRVAAILVSANRSIQQLRENRSMHVGAKTDSTYIQTVPAYISHQARPNHCAIMACNCTIVIEAGCKAM